MGPNITGPAISPHVGYDPINDFSHIAMIAGDSTLFAVNPALGVKTLLELVALAKSGTVAISCGSPGVGTIGHLSLEQFRRKAGVMNIVHVPYRGGGPLAIDLLGNHVSTAFIATASGIEQVRAGTMIPLAVTTSERVVDAQGCSDFRRARLSRTWNSTTWGWLAGPPNMPPEIVNKLNAAVRDIHQYRHRCSNISRPSRCSRRTWIRRR